MRFIGSKLVRFPLAKTLLTQKMLLAQLPALIFVIRLPMSMCVLAGSTKNYDWNSKIGSLEQWDNAGIGELCKNRSELLQQLEKKPLDNEYREKLTALSCDESLRLDCNFEIPDTEQVVMVCDCQNKQETWDETVKQCRRFAGRKQSCTEDSHCVTGATCKNEELKLREYSRWESAVLRLNNKTTPRSFSQKNVMGKLQRLDITDARRRRKRILSRIVRHSYKEEIGECTCSRNKLALEHINKTDPCISRKYPPPLNLNSPAQSIFCPTERSFAVYLPFAFSTHSVLHHYLPQ